MSLAIFSCKTCLEKYFPARLRCSRCGSSEFQQSSVEVGVVTGVTKVHRIPEGCDFKFLVALDVAPRVPVIAVCTENLEVGIQVLVAQRADGAVYIPLK